VKHDPVEILVGDPEQMPQLAQGVVFDTAAADVDLDSEVVIPHPVFEQGGRKRLAEAHGSGQRSRFGRRAGGPRAPQVPCDVDPLQPAVFAVVARLERPAAVHGLKVVDEADLPRVEHEVLEPGIHQTDHFFESLPRRGILGWIHEIRVQAEIRRLGAAVEQRDLLGSAHHFIDPLMGCRVAVVGGGHPVFGQMGIVRTDRVVRLEEQAERPGVELRDVDGGECRRHLVRHIIPR
jgi:hypothetical protein